MSLDSQVDGPVTVDGVALDVQAGAIVMTDEGRGVFIDGLESWPKGAHNRRVEARGVLRRSKLAPDPHVEDGVHTAGMHGTQLVLEAPTWRIVG